MSAQQSQGVTLHISVPGSPTQLQQVAHLTSFTLDIAAPEIDTTDLDSPAAEVLVGVPKYTVSANFNMDPDNARHQELRNAIANRTKIQARITLTDSTPTMVTFEGYLSSLQFSGEVNDAVRGSLSIAVDRGFTWQ